MSQQVPKDPKTMWMTCFLQHCCRPQEGLAWSSEEFCAPCMGPRAQRWAVSGLPSGVTGSIHRSFRAPWICQQDRLRQWMYLITHHSSCKEAHKTYVLTQRSWEPCFQTMKEIIKNTDFHPILGDAALGADGRRQSRLQRWSWLGAARPSRPETLAHNCLTDYLSVSILRHMRPGQRCIHWP